MAYTKHQWIIGEAITQNLMDHIEQGISDAQSAADSKVSEQTLNDITRTINDTLTGHGNRLTTIESQMETVQQATTQFSEIVAEVQSANQVEEGAEPISLDQRFSNDEAAIKEVYDLASNTFQVVYAAYNNSEVILTSDGTVRQARSLLEKITDLESKIRTATEYANSAMAILNPQVDGQRSIAQRVTALDGDTVPSRNVPSIITELETARGVDSNNVARETLSARFIADEERIGSLEIAMPQRVRYSDIQDNLTSEDALKPLSANQGRTLAGMIAQAQTDATAAANAYSDANKIDKQSIANNLNTSAILTGYVLDARQGAALNTRLENVETELANAHVTGESTSLDARFDSIDGGSAPTRTLPNVIEELEAARTSHAIQWDDNGTLKDTEYASLDARLEAIESTNATLDSTLDTRLDAIDGGATPSRTLQDVTTEVENARSSVAKGTEDEITHEVTPLVYNTVDERLEAIETDIDAIATELSMYDVANQITGTTSRIDNIETNIITMAKEIGMIQDGAIVTDLSNAVLDTNSRVDRIDGRVTGIESELQTARIQIGTDENEQPIMSTLDQRLDGIDTGITTIKNTLGAGFDTTTNTVAAKIAAAETNAVSTAQSYTDTATAEIGAAHRTGLVDGNNEPITDSLDNRFDDIEDRIDAIDTPSTGAIAGLTGRVGTLETDVNTPITGIKGRLDTAEYQISHSASQEDATTGLTERITAAETAIATKATSTDLSNLTNRVQTLEDTPKSATTIISFDRITYNNETGLPTIYTDNSKTDLLTPTEESDYLLQEQIAQNNTVIGGKYYYWKYIGIYPNGTWNQISGGGEGGNNSGYDFENEADYLLLVQNNAYAENTDYYVQKADGTHHYRWVPYTDLDTNSTSLVQIEIGGAANTNNIKKYNITIEEITDQSTGVTDNYLCFYEFNYGVDNTIDSTDNVPIVPTQPLRRIKLPATGGGGGISTGTLKFSRITTRLFTSALNGDQPITVKFFFTTGEENDGAYYDLYIGRIVTSGNTTSIVDERKVISDQPITSGDPANKSTTWPTKVITVNGESVVVPKAEDEVATGFYSVDISQYFSAVGYYSIRLEARSAENTNITGGINWELHTINFYVTSSSEDGLIISTDDTVSLEYTPFGTIEKTLHIVIDDNEENQITKVLSDRTSGRSDTIDIPAQAHGLHKIDMYMDAVINNIVVPTKHVYREYIWYNPSNTSQPIIVASRYNNQTVTLEAYTELRIPYSVYYKEDEDYLVEYYRNYGTANQALLGQVTCHGNTVSYFDYIPAINSDVNETQTITIKVGNQTASVNLIITPIKQTISPISGAIIDFDPSSLTNSSIGREPEWKTATNAYDEYLEWTPNITYPEGATVLYDGYAYICRTSNRDSVWTPSHWNEQGAYKYTFKVSDNFNWSNDASGGGYKEDEDGKCFVIKAGSYVDINYKMFKSNDGQSAIYDTGTEMKVIFKTTAVRDSSAIWFTNAKAVNNKQIGIQLSAHQGWLKTDKASDGVVSGSSDEYQDWVASTHYYVDDIVVYKRTTDGTIYKCITENEDAKLDKTKWLKLGQIERQVDATNTYLYFPYSEEDRIELDININKYDATKNNNFIMSYEDGVPSKALPYIYGPGGDGLYHNPGEEATIRIGSPDCDVHIYRLRIYNTSLDTDQILQNFIADGKTVQEKKDRYERNAIYWDEDHREFYTTPSNTAKLDPIKLAEKMPGVKILMLDAPTFTLHKKSLIRNTSLRCLQIQQDANGNFIYPAEGNWFFDKGYHAGQGTTSDNYGQAGRNLDFLFECDGVHYPANPKDMTDWTTDGTYKSELYRGNNGSVWTKVIDETEETPAIYAWRPADGVSPETCEDWRGDDCKVQLTSTSVPNNYFNLKVNIASSENVNNALFQKRYNEYIQSLSPSPATERQNAYHHYSTDSRFSGPVDVKNTMEFVPAVIFLRENSADLDSHVEFKDRDWHFYALGNIGDSKKTDYTRAYDPTDVNEFTLEISDNNTNNSQFQSGVYEDNGQQVVEQADGSISTSNYIWGITDEQWNATRSPNADELEVRAAINGGAEDLVDVIMGGEEEDGSDGRVYVNYRHRMLSSEPFDGDHSFEFRYASQGSYRDGKIINPKDKNNPEYKTIKAQEKLNRRVFEAFYSWLVTATDAQFQSEAELWFVPRAMAFFYAFTHYYTMMDNRAKNTFWHFARTSTRHAVPIGRAVPALMHIYEEDDGNGGYQPASGDFDNTKQYYTQYAFDLWVYDCDTALGIDNNGALVFPYGKEDTDYRTEGDPLSGSAFNGAGSIFWRRLSRAFASEIRDVMTQANVNCFNAQHLINQFDETQNCYPEEVWRLDIERKYIRTFTGVSSAHPYDNAVAEGKQNPRFLRSMMQGRKKYQRRQWIRDQGVYFNSKYRLNDIIKNENTIEFNATTPDLPLWSANTQYYINDYVRTRVEPFDDLHPQFKVYRCITANSDSIFNASNWQESVTPSYLLSLVPYQDMYLNVQVGNGNYKPSYITDGEATLRAKAGREYIFDISGNKQETRIYINGANSLSGIGNLAPMYPYEFDLRALGHLKNLNIGTDDPTYVNTKFVSLGLETDKPLLESINVKNCHSLGGSLNLSNASNIRTVEATGSAITSVTLPQYTNIETLHLPTTTTDISIYAARKLTDFQVIDGNGNIDYSRITKLEITDSDYSANIDWIDIALDMINTSTTVKLLDLNIASINNIEELEPFRLRKQLIETGGAAIVLSGDITVNGEWSEVVKNQYETLWNGLTLHVIDDAEHKKVKHRLTYNYEIDGLSYSYSKYVNHGATVDDIYALGLIEKPTKLKTEKYEYSFGRYESSGDYIELSGWKVQGDSETLAQKEDRGVIYRVEDDAIIEAVFNSTLRKYQVRWMMNNTDIVDISKQVNYGEGETLEAPTVTDIQKKGYSTSSITFNRGTNPIQVTYKIFNGWEKLPINVHPSADNSSYYDIKPKWIEGKNVDLPDIFEDTTNLTPIQMLVFANMTDAERAQYLQIGKQFSIQMGYQGSDDSGELIIGPGATHQLTSGGTNSTIRAYDIARFTVTNGTRQTLQSTIQPLKAGADEFTIAIDYAFDQDGIEAQTANEMVLVSCYEKTETTTAGFRLYHRKNEGPKVSFGDTTIDNGNTLQSRLVGTVSTAKYRNTIVLRHPANSTVLYVYSGMGRGGTRDDGSILSDLYDENFIQTIEWQNVNTDAYLIFGNLSMTNTSSTMVPGKGKIFWAKYWDKDLGAGECRQLAAWNHETMTFGIEEYSGMNSAIGRKVFPDSVETAPNVVITSLNVSNYGHVATYAQRTDGDIIKWPGSVLQNVANKRIFNSLPNSWQAIITKSPVKSRQVRFSSNGFNGYSYSIGESDVQTSNDYIFFPSSVEFGNGDTEYYKTYEANGVMSWMTGANVNVYSYNSGTQTWSTGTINASYMNLRFPNVPIHTEGNVLNRVFVGYTGSTSIYDRIGDVQRGDIIIVNDTDAYIYVSASDVANGMYIQPSTAPANDGDSGSYFYCATGGWVKAEYHWTRSPFNNHGTYGAFMYVDSRGILHTSADAHPTTGYALNYSFSI